MAVAIATAGLGEPEQCYARLLHNIFLAAEEMIPTWDGQYEGQRKRQGR